MTAEFLILDVHRLKAKASPAWETAEIIPWLVELGKVGHSMHPAPYLRVHDRFGPIVDVVASRWYGPSESWFEVAYAVAAKGNPGRALLSYTGGKGEVVYGWSAPPVEPTPEALRLMREWAELDTAPVLQRMQTGRPAHSSRIRG